MKHTTKIHALFATAALALIATAPLASAADAYIESDGTQFMNTGYHPSGKTKIEVDFQLTEAIKGKDCVFGNYGDANFSVLLYAQPETQARQFQFCGKDGGWQGTSVGVVIDTERHTMVIDVPKKQGTMFAPDGTVQGRRTSTEHGRTRTRQAGRLPFSLRATAHPVTVRGRAPR